MALPSNGTPGVAVQLPTSPVGPRAAVLTVGMPAAATRARRSAVAPLVAVRRLRADAGSGARVERRQRVERLALAPRQRRVADERPFAGELLGREDGRLGCGLLPLGPGVADEPPLAVCGAPRRRRVVARAVDDGIDRDVKARRLVLCPVCVEWVGRIGGHRLREVRPGEAAFELTTNFAEARIDNDRLAVHHGRAARVDGPAVVGLVIPNAHGQTGPVDKVAAHDVADDRTVAVFIVGDNQVVLIH